MALATRPKPFRLLALFPLVLTLAGCGEDAVPAEPAQRPIGIESGDPLAGVPREELYGVSPVENLWSPRVELEVLDLPAGWHGARVAILSDFQLGLWDGNAEVAGAAVRRAVEANPDLIVLLGDYLARGEDTAELDRVLAPLRGRRAIGVLGDRDVRSDSVEARVAGALRAAGVHILRNSSVALERRGDTIHVAGLDPDLVGRPWADQQYILATVGVADRTPILLTHNPAMITRAPMRRFAITVAGNTFCGQAEVPGSPRLAWLRSEVFPGGTIEGVDRLFRVQGSTVFVTCGTGYGFMPLRFGAAPEVPILTILGVGRGVAPPVAPLVEDSVLRRYQAAPADTL